LVKPGDKYNIKVSTEEGIGIVQYKQICISKGIQKLFKDLNRKIGLDFDIIKKRFRGGR